MKRLYPTLKEERYFKLLLEKYNLDTYKCGIPVLQHPFPLPKEK